MSVVGDNIMPVKGEGSILCHFGLGLPGRSPLLASIQGLLRTCW